MGPDYKPEANQGLTYAAAMEEIHAILPDGTVVKGVEVFRRLYEEVGLGFVYAATKASGRSTACRLRAGGTWRPCSLDALPETPRPVGRGTKAHFFFQYSSGRSGLAAATHRTLHAPLKKKKKKKKKKVLCV